MTIKKTLFVHCTVKPSRSLPVASHTLSLALARSRLHLEATLPHSSNSHSRSCFKVCSRTHAHTHTHTHTFHMYVHSSTVCVWCHIIILTHRLSHTCSLSLISSNSHSRSCFKHTLSVSQIVRHHHLRVVKRRTSDSGFGGQVLVPIVVIAVSSSKSCPSIPHRRLSRRRTHHR
jgi:hypothetical protein